MNKIGLSALLLACVAFILLPDVSQATSDENLEVLKKMQPVTEELLEDSSLSEDSKSDVTFLNDRIKYDLAQPSEKSWVARTPYLYIYGAKRVLKQEGLSDEAKKNIEDVIELLGQLKKDEN